MRNWICIAYFCRALFFSLCTGLVIQLQHFSVRTCTQLPLSPQKICWSLKLNHVNNFFFPRSSRSFFFNSTVLSVFPTFHLEIPIKRSCSQYSDIVPNINSFIITAVYRQLNSITTNITENLIKNFLQKKMTRHNFQAFWLDDWFTIFRTIVTFNLATFM